MSGPIAAHATTMIPLRIAAIVANALAMSYSFLHGTYPTFALNAILLPINAWRLRSMLNLIRNINEATKGDMNVDWLLPYTRPVHFKAGDVIWVPPNEMHQFRNTGSEALKFICLIPAPMDCTR